MTQRERFLDRLELSTPWMNAAGFLGYFPPTQRSWGAPMGAFVTNPVSLLPRKPAQLRQVVEYPGGFLLHTGLPSPGIASVLKQNAARWGKIAVPVWVHLLTQTPAELPEMIETLEGVENVRAVELGIPPGVPLKTILEFIHAASGEIATIACICVDEIQNEWISSIQDAGAAGLVLAAPRGMHKNSNRLTRGRLYGPAIFPYMLNAVCRLAQHDLPIIAGGGVYSQADGETLLEAGAAAVQLDAVLWRNWET